MRATKRPSGGSMLRPTRLERRLELPRAGQILLIALGSLLLLYFAWAGLRLTAMDKSAAQGRYRPVDDAALVRMAATPQETTALLKDTLPPLLVPRPVGSKAHAAVREVREKREREMAETEMAEMEREMAERDG